MIERYKAATMVTKLKASYSEKLFDINISMNNINDIHIHLGGYLRDIKGSTGKLKINRQGG